MFYDECDPLDLGKANRWVCKVCDPSELGKANRSNDQTPNRWQTAHHGDDFHKQLGLPPNKP
ncbi:MAG: hypothetical protein KME43_16170 [Myxacorys chilensis ATA2-1-KO14]|nr:hypothetical protein [Myxacorys chilensis ATA2-1-KO14]